MRSALRLEIVLLLLAAISFPGRSAYARIIETPSPALEKLEGAPAALKSIVASGRLEDLRWPDFSDYRLLVRKFYTPTYDLAWIRNGEPTAQAEAAIQILRDADREGLRAEDYDASRWADRLTLLKGAHDAAVEANFDAALTVCVMRYVSDVRIGRIDPRHMRFEFDTSQKKLELPDFLRERLVDGYDLPGAIAEVEPPFAGYRGLRKGLLHYMELAKIPDGEKLTDPGEVTPGHLYSKTPRLAERLRALGDLPEGVTVPQNSMLYHGELVDAVKHFQERHGIKPTGVIDSRTIAELNVPIADRVEQIQLSLERYRWVPYQFEQPPVVVNVPEFQLYCFDADGKVALTMEVNVGDQYNFQTPMFENNIEYVVFRPYWVPPPNILRNEILPDLEHTPSLTKNDLELVSASGQVIRSGDVTAAMMQQIRTGALTVRQPPGPENALGLVKVIFPNDHYVYMHDTPAGEDKFSPAKRAFSHGCIHVERPAEFAAWLLRNNSGWDLERVRQAMHDGPDNVRVNLASPIPVLIVYQTAVAKEDGDVHFFDDIYNHDAELKEELAKGYPYPRK